MFSLLVAMMLAQPPVEVGPTTAAVDYLREVRPILETQCFSCHAAEKQRGGLRIDRSRDALDGGDSGPAIEPGKPGESLLLERVMEPDPELRMPPGGDPLPTSEVETLRKWIAEGPAWPADATGNEPAESWWSFRPLRRPPVPDVPQRWRERARNPIDAFILDRLDAVGLAPSAEADQRTLLRRVYFDLTGLPPAPKEVEAFLADARPGAYERTVDRLLASPRYGERWARHWLDVVHYADTHGYDKDQPRPNAWPYRDYVIRALNEDRPYARFVQEQLAGDVLYPGTKDGITALGFIAAGPWDLIGHAEVPESKIDGKIARHLDRDDMVATSMQTFVSLTAQCAQCHNHKFDPIRQEEYYRLQAVFAAVDRADRPYYEDPGIAARAGALTAAARGHRKRLTDLDAMIRERAGPELAAIEEEIVAAGAAPTRAEYGYHSAIEPAPDCVKWVQVDLGGPVRLERVVLWPCHDDFNGIGAGFGFPRRFRVEVSDEPGFTAGSSVIADRTGEDVPNPRTAPVSFDAGGVVGRYLRVTATRLAPRANDYILALAELEAIDARGVNVAHGAAVAALDSIEAAPRWQRVNLVDGQAPGLAAGADPATLRERREQLIAQRVDPEVRKEQAAVSAALAGVQAEMDTLPAPGLVYAGTVHSGTGAFRGTGPEGRPRPIHVLRRGDVKTPGPEVGPGALALIPELPGSFGLPHGDPEGSRRAALAAWLTDPRNPLTWRSIVNRVWQYHFGRGIVPTPSDFGRMGEPPSHPELLDWLAAEFRDSGQSLKELHRLIVTSATYRQVSAGNEAMERLDATNAYLWRMNRRKLEAEALRDSMLAVAGRLDPTMYGPAFQDFVVEHPEHSPHYQYEPYDPDDPRACRRAIYRFIVRSRPQPFLTALDCADPSMQVEKRNETLSPLQALAVWNNGLVLAMAGHLAERARNAGDEDEQVQAAFRMAIGREPDTAEREGLVSHAREHGLAQACRVILNMNEFLFVD